MLGCIRCLKSKRRHQFYKRSDNCKHSTVCKQCHRDYQTQRRRELPDYQRARYLKRYGLSLEQYKQMVKDQNGQCAMCSATQKRALSVDHHHASGKVRQLLCGSCNALLGLAKERKEILLAAIYYLDKHSNSI